MRHNHITVGRMNRFRTRATSLRSAIGFIVIAASCGEPQRERTAETSQQPGRYVAFRQPDYTMDRFETPVAPPVAIGSTLSGELLSSSDPKVVSIDSAGNLVAHKNGEAIVRAAGGASLNVRVNAVQAMQIVPGVVELAPGASTSVRVLGDGHEMSPDLYRWETTDPNVAAGFGSTVQAGYRSGEATLTARSGSSEAVLTVAVKSGPIRLRVVGGSRTIAVGHVEQFRVEGVAQVPLVWSSTNTAVLQPLRDGLFYARAEGKSEACVEAKRARSCRFVRVTAQSAQ